MNNFDAGAKIVLVVEDEPAICEICLRILTSEGLEVDIAGNGAIAQAMMTGKDYDLCLIDLRTPVMNGKELYRYINEKHPKLVDRVILTTGDVISKETEGFLEQSGRPFLLKPFTPDELKTMVREVLGQTNDWKIRNNTDY